MSKKHAVRADDRRKGAHKSRGVRKPESGAGESSPLADLFNDRRHSNGKGKRAV